MKKRSLLVSLIICLVLMSVPVLVHAAESGAEEEVTSDAAAMAEEDADADKTLTEEDAEAVVDKTLMKEDEEAENGKPLTEYWSEDSQAAESLRAYVSKVTDENDAENFIPVKDRIAVFDMDGTLTCETFFT